jgi:hypothetical protein
MTERMSDSLSWTERMGLAFYGVVGRSLCTSDPLGRRFVSLLILVLFFRASVSGGPVPRTIRDRGLEQRCPNTWSS